MERDIIYDSKERPHVESNFEIFLKFVLRFIKAVSFVAQMVFQSGVDNKKIIKE